MNLWALAKDRAIRLALLRMANDFDLQRLALNCEDDQHHRAVRLCDPTVPRLSAYLFTFGQPPGHYGLELQYPTTVGKAPPYDALEELTLNRVVDLLAMHFELT